MKNETGSRVAVTLTDTRTKTPPAIRASSRSSCGERCWAGTDVGDLDVAVDEVGDVAELGVAQERRVLVAREVPVVGDDLTDGEGVPTTATAEARRRASHGSTSIGTWPCASGSSSGQPLVGVEGRVGVLLLEVVAEDLQLDRVEVVVRRLLEHQRPVVGLARVDELAVGTSTASLRSNSLASGASSPSKARR